MYRRYLLCVSTLAALVMAGFGCQSEINPASMEDGPSATVTIHGLQLLVASDPLAPAGVAAVEVTPGEGGQVSRGGVTLSVPAGAVGAATTITMERIPGLQGYVFGPSGLRFGRPATLAIQVNAASLRASGIDPRRLAVAGASDDADDWSVVGGAYDPATGTVTVPIYHFSRYALIVN
jgi:hypothetical protein